ncbi:MAG: sigma-54-dependent Fis family transcriptional regulator [Alphaproteobacteria bacterium]|nr:sigma-54-dependent Fis family transcriptional regulator [Alphaproteobacteria bacterium]
MPAASSEGAFYAALLDLTAPTTDEELDQLLRQALALAVDLVGARRGYIELIDQHRRPSWSHGFDAQAVQRVRSRVSSGILAATVAEGRPLRLVDALKDPRFEHSESVQTLNIVAVLCAPIGQGLGTIYLEGRQSPGPFSDRDEAAIVRMGRHLALLFDRLLAAHRPEVRAPGLDPREGLNLDGLLGNSEAMNEVILRVRRIEGPIDEPVVLTGPTGVGKTTLARIIHANAHRRARPFVVFNCAELSQELVESELFGAVRGAHSTAHADRTGVVAEAHGGTLFLDELHHLNLTAQGALLRFLERGEYRPVGASRSRQADVRVIAAMNVEPQQVLRDGSLREDLWYRLSAYVIAVPSLVERREDIALLARHFCSAFTARYNMEPRRLSPAFVLALQSREWEGNIRELRNVIRMAVLETRFPKCLELQPEHLRDSRTDSPSQRLEVATLRFQRAHVLEILHQSGSTQEASARLGLARSSFYDLLKRLEIDLREARRRRSG